MSNHHKNIKLHVQRKMLHNLRKQKKTMAGIKLMLQCGVGWKSEEKP